MWPFELHKLSSIVPGFSASGMADKRLTELYSHTRGCGGVGILWKKSLDISSLHTISTSDRICAIEVQLYGSETVKKLVIYNVYCPSSEYSSDQYQQCILDLEAELNLHQNESTAIVIAGDFNAHLGTLAGCRGTGPADDRGFLLKELIDRNNLFVASHCSVSSGPGYTYHSGRNFTTIDYIITNKPASDLLIAAKVNPDHSLNVSDHLSLTLSLDLNTGKGKSINAESNIYWDKAISSGLINSYTLAVSNVTTPLLNSTCEDITQLDEEIQYVCANICKLACSILPKYSPSRKRSRNFFKDDQLKHLCRVSKEAYHEWKNKGKSCNGDLFDNKTAAKKAVRKRINELKARKDRLQSECIDDQFQSKSRSRFRRQRNGTPCGSKLLINGSISTSNTDIMAAWSEHFQSLGKSVVPETPVLQQLESNISHLYSSSLANEDFVLDTKITAEEVERVVKMLKRRKSSGPDGIQTEHIIYGGTAMILWLQRVFNHIIEFEQIPPCLNNAIIVPIYKGKGKNPLQTSSYRGISLTSIVGKLLERIILYRITPLLEERGIPHYTQTAYQSGLSCADPTEAVQEAIRSHIQHGSTAYQCFYDLEKAFDSIEYCVLLTHLYSSGINGKGWRLISSFYSRPSGQVRICNQLTNPFTLQRGIRQGSVMSPMLFLIVIDSLLRELENANAGISVNGIYAGSFGHADDLRSVAPNLMCVERQAEIVESFTNRNGLKLNLDKLELLPMHQGKNLESGDELRIGSISVRVSRNPRCLGVIWSHDLSPKQSVEANIKKAHKAFFALGSLGVYQGKQNPLTSSEVYKVCIVPVCLYGSENWLLTDQLLDLLERFQSDVGKRILNLPKYHSNLCSRIALNWSSMRLRILKRKMRFLVKLMKPENMSISAKVFRSLREDGVEPLAIQQCKYLEQEYDTNFTQAILTDSDVSINSIFKALKEADQDYTRSLVSKSTSLKHLAVSIPWLKLWDIARDRGIQGARSLQAILRVLTAPVFADMKCNFCNVDISNYSDHVLQTHLSTNTDDILQLLKDESDEIFPTGLKLMDLRSQATEMSHSVSY